MGKKGKQPVKEWKPPSFWGIVQLLLFFAGMGIGAFFPGIFLAVLSLFGQTITTAVEIAYISVTFIVLGLIYWLMMNICKYGVQALFKGVIIGMGLFLFLSIIGINISII